MFAYNVAYADDDDVIRTDNNSTVTSNGSMDTTIYSPPPSAISPNLSTGSGDLCSISASASIQTQILGFSAGKVFTEKNCIRLKNATTLYDMGMKVAAVSVMCQDKRIFTSMLNAGTPCPFDGLVGQPAKEAWKNNPQLVPGAKSGSAKEWSDDDKNTAKGAAGIGGLLALLLLLI